MPGIKVSVIMNLMKLTLLCILIVIILGMISFFVFGNSKDKDTPLSDGKISLCNKEVSYGLADSEKERDRGLSDRSNLLENEGMLFVFDEQVKPSFWMKDMNFPIDIIWIDESKKIVDITEDFKPSSYPKTVAPVLPVKYVLEVNSGFALRNHCIVSAEVKF